MFVWSVGILRSSGCSLCISLERKVGGIPSNLGKLRKGITTWKGNYLELQERGKTLSAIVRKSSTYLDLFVCRSWCFLLSKCPCFPKLLGKNEAEWGKMEPHATPREKRLSMQPDVFLQTWKHWNMRQLCGFAGSLILFLTTGNTLSCHGWWTPDCPGMGRWGSTLK